PGQTAGGLAPAQGSCCPVPSSGGGSSAVTSSVRVSTRPSLAEAVRTKDVSSSTTTSIASPAGERPDTSTTVPFAFSSIVLAPVVAQDSVTSSPTTTGLGVAVKASIRNEG